MEALRAQIRALCACRARRAVTEHKASGEFLTGGACEASALEAAIGDAERKEAVMPLRQKSPAGGGERSRCVRCGRWDSSPSFCEVAVRSIYDGAPPCRHGPFCSRCRGRLRSMTLSTCVCRAIISTWPDRCIVDSHSMA
mmetsp:Transcript_50730/g.120598  ORF Transcript_50730/g.120598 Transcript_50730/m.120598 type:complete len:140 (-) Transcript_50730:154-573(-)